MLLLVLQAQQLLPLLVHLPVLLVLMLVREAQLVLQAQLLLLLLKVKLQFRSLVLQVLLLYLVPIPEREMLPVLTAVMVLELTWLLFAASACASLANAHSGDVDCWSCC